MLPPILTLPPATPVPGWWVADMLKLGIVVIVLKMNTRGTYEQAVDECCDFTWRVMVYHNYHN
jgi:hypothetical protein